jgi:holo-[acyl-carrier protein] synthase
VTLGIDLVQISRMGESVSAFRERFLRRVFTPREIEYAQAASDGGLQRLASRFAAKEAAIKALGLSALGGTWRDIEVQRSNTGAVALALHGRVAQYMQLRGLASVSVSMSHEGDWATAVVAAVF